MAHLPAAAALMLVLCVVGEEAAVLPAKHASRGAVRGFSAIALRGGGGAGEGAPMEMDDAPGQSEVLSRSIEMMEAQMQKAAAEMKFEDAARLRDVITVLKQGAGPAAEASAANGKRPDAHSEPKLTFDWERKRGVAPVLQSQDTRPVQSGSPHKRSVPESPEASLFPASDAAFAEEGRAKGVEPVDRAIANALNEARHAMQHADDGGELNICNVIRAFDAALEHLVGEGSKDSPLQLVACLRLLLQTVSSVSHTEARVIDLAAEPFSQFEAPLLQLVREALMSIGFNARSDGLHKLQLVDDYPLYVLREAQGSIEIKLAHVEPHVAPTQQQASLGMELEERDVVVLVARQGPVQVPEVPEEVYNFTARDLIDVLESNKKMLEESSTLMTSEMRQRRMHAHRASIHTTCRVRMRLSDGTLLESSFAPHEGVAALHSVLAHVLRPGAPEPVLTTMLPVKVLTTVTTPSTPAASGEQKTDDPKELEADTMQSLGLVPTGIINCRGAGGRPLGRDCLRNDVPVREM